MPGSTLLTPPSVRKEEHAADGMAGDVAVDTNPLHRMTISKMIGQGATKDNAKVSFI